jgi:hypothetical protein
MISSQSRPPNTEAAILARLIQMGHAQISRDAAEYLLSIHFDERDVSRMDELSELARQGRLTAEEQAELDSYIHVGNLIATMQSKARSALSRATQ